MDGFRDADRQSSVRSSFIICSKRSIGVHQRAVRMETKGAKTMTDKNILSEQESKKLITEMVLCTPSSEVYNDVAIFLTKLYDRGYQVCKKIDKKET